MGFFDKILKGAAKAIDDAVSKNGGESSGFTNLVNKDMDMKDSVINGSSAATTQTASAPKSKNTVRNRKTTPAEILAYGDRPSKPSVPYDPFETGIYYAEDKNGNDIEVKISFTHSGDFISVGDFGAGELEDVLIFAPQYDDREVLYDDESIIMKLIDESPSIQLVYAPEDKIYNATEAYKSSKTPFADAMEFEPLDRGIFLYKAKIMNRFGSVVYFYAMDRGNIWDNCYLGAVYNPDIMGTALERKVIAAVDEIVSTYKETIINKKEVNKNV